MDQCRREVTLLVTPCRDLAKAVPTGKGTAPSQAASALEAFAPRFFNDMVLVFDEYFVNRTRTLEQKDGNPLNEVRLISTS